MGTRLGLADATVSPRLQYRHKVFSVSFLFLFFVLPAHHVSLYLICDIYFFFLSAKSSCGRPNVTEQRAKLRPENINSISDRVGDDKDKKAKTGVQMQNKSKKRKQADCKQQGDLENQPPQKKSVVAKVPEKSLSKGASKKKLIAGQGKLTSFFRV